MRVVICIVLILLLLWYVGSRTSSNETMFSTLYKQRVLILHYVPWSPLCQEVIPLWNRMRDTLGKQLIMTTVNEDIAKTYYVSTYPTIYMVDENGKRHRYPGVFNYQALSNWCLAPTFADAVR